ncbi:acetylornithine deacetylase [Knoellia sinensis KCTC 19936]|uniref:Acetylornithine deacetylase n=1 Tax=Knoellia sinensis KCTC 19936 TaxID=1385520 RepID=A0A0A0J237_9MICO|nr:M20/M25/M40 family metallo-hydrolase [Knoellia sinensis]KGN30212.1 acetylornithine deacetylase [Knoellia sinensis KCTC 19936]
MTGRQDAVELLAELVSIDSVNPGLVRGAAGERAILERLSSRLSAAGFTVTSVPLSASPGRASLVAVPPAVGDGDVPTIILNGHLDTVGVAGMADPFTPRVDGDRLHGRGAADMKGGVAALVVAAERVVAAGAPIRPVLALVADEEDLNAGSESVIATLPDLGVHPDLCLIAEPTDLALARSLRGFAVIRVTFRGRAAHSSQAELGINAITHLGQFLYAVDRHAPNVRARGGDLMVTVASGGSSPFVVPDEAECLVEMRTTPEQACGEALAEVRSLLEPEWQAEATLVAGRDGWRMDESGPAVDYAAALGGRLGTAPTFDAPYWMEAPLWQQVCPTVICGPSGGGLHAADEWVSLGQVSAFTDALIHVLNDWRPTRPHTETAQESR